MQVANSWYVGNANDNAATDRGWLERAGDYAVWGPGIDHTWQAEADAVVITVRWPSLPA